MNRRLSVLCVFAAGLVLLAGCNLPEPQADPVRHFTLSAATAGKPAPAQARSGSPRRAVQPSQTRALRNMRIQGV